MVFGQDRDGLRRFYCTSFRKRLAGAPLEPLEAQVAAVVAEHPEYHDFFSDEDDALLAEFGPERGMTNPFLHLGMHLAIREQAMIDRPAGIAALYSKAVAARGMHEAEHAIMECLGEMLWRASRDGGPPDEVAYLECVRRIAG